MKPPFIELSGNKNGQAVVFASFFTLALLIIGGVSVDSAHVFLSKSKAQRAVDASAMAGITQYENGITDPVQIKAGAEKMARFNLNRSNIKDSEIEILSASLNVDANRVARLTVNGTIKSPTFFMRMIPGPALDTVTIRVKSTSKRNPAVISLILDTSGSMDGSKIQALKNAANAFVDSFENGLDSMAIVGFSYRANLLSQMAPVNKTALHNIINSVSADGWTNISEACSMGRKQIENTNNPDAVKAILLFTDGAPNAYRAYFLNGKNPLTKNYPTVNPQYYDYIIYANESPRRVIVPSNLSVKCSAGSSSLSNCFNNFGYKDSKMNTRVSSATISLNNSNTAISKESFHLGIIETDYAKGEAITMYTVGLGTQATQGADVYQDVLDDQKIKSYFLRRVANDPAGKNDPVFPNLPNNPAHPAGIYFQTPNPADLVGMFQTVAKRIKLRLIE